MAHSSMLHIRSLMTYIPLWVCWVPLWYPRGVTGVHCNIPELTMGKNNGAPSGLSQQKSQSDTERYSCLYSYVIHKNGTTPNLFDYAAISLFTLQCDMPGILLPKLPWDTTTLPMHTLHHNTKGPNCPLFKRITELPAQQCIMAHWSSQGLLSTVTPSGIICKHFTVSPMVFHWVTYRYFSKFSHIIYQLTPL